MVTLKWGQGKLGITFFRVRFFLDGDSRAAAQEGSERPEILPLGRISAENGPEGPDKAS